MAVKNQKQGKTSIRVWRHTMKSYEVRYREVLFTGEDYELAHKFFGDLLSKPFSLITPKETYPNKRFTYDPERRRIRLPCTFFERLNVGDVIVIEKSDNEILISVEQSRKTPGVSVTADIEIEPLALGRKIIELQDKIITLQEENAVLREYKQRLEEFEDLDYFFADEAEMEQWLIKNMHKVLPEIEVVDRQIWATWKNLNRNRVDIFGMDKNTKDLVVIEVKTRKRRLRTVETQYMFYKTWVLRNLDLINEKYVDRGLRASRDFEFVIITDRYDARLQEVCQAFGICLICIDGGIHCEEVVPYRGILSENEV